MIEIAVRINQLITSNVNAAVDAASNPAKLLKLMILEMEEAIIALTRDKAQRERLARELNNQAVRDEKAAQEWQEKARFAMGKQREDLARGALIERDNARAAAMAAKQGEAEALADADKLRDTIGQLEARLGDARTRLTQERAASDRTAGASTAHSVPPSTRAGAPDRTEQVIERIDRLEKRIDFANAGAAPAARSASLDQELAEMARDERIEAELAEMREAAGGKVKKKK